MQAQPSRQVRRAEERKELKRKPRIRRKPVQSWRCIHGLGYLLYNGDFFDCIHDIPDNYVDSIVVDPPYGLEFMGEDWDTPGAGIEATAKSAGGFGADEPTNVNAFAAARVRYGKTNSKKLWTERPEKERRRAAGKNDAFDKGLPCYESGGIVLMEWHMSWLKEVFRVLKPGGYILAFSGTRTYHWLAAAVELTGFEVRDQIDWIYGSGFPKYQNIQRAVDMKVCRESGTPGRHYEANLPAEDKRKPGDHICEESEEGLKYAGFTSAIKPAHEPICMARKPLSEKTIVANVLKHGTGALNTDSCRVDRDPDDIPGWHKTGSDGRKGYKDSSTFRTRKMSAEEIRERNSGGRWPANLILSHDANCTDSWCSVECPVKTIDVQAKGASRFFYCPKPSTKERDEGLDDFPLEDWVQFQTANGTSKKPSSISAGRNTKRRNTHPTPKPVELMRWLVRLVTPPGGRVLDNFMGSGPVGVACMKDGFEYVGIERKHDFFGFAVARIKYHAEKREVRNGRIEEKFKEARCSKAVPRIRRKRSVCG